ncbi:hypothetical protein [Desulfobulbus propionicus]|jgi:hypothetical protein
MPHCPLRTFLLPWLPVRVLFSFWQLVPAKARAAVELRVGILDIKPFIFLSQDQRPTGHAFDPGQAIAANQNRQDRFVPTPRIFRPTLAIFEGLKGKR